MALRVATSPLDAQTKSVHSGNGFVLNQKTETEAGRYVSEARYWAEYYDRGDFSYEWNNGKLEVRPVSDYAQFCLYYWFMALVHDFLHVNPIARMVGLEMGFRMELPNRTTIRKPDLGIVLDSNPNALGDKDRSYHGIFDLCIESISDSDKEEVERDTVVKKEEYAQAGVTEYFILDENGRETAFYRLSQHGVYVPIQPEKGIIRSSVLKGFQFRVSDLYLQPQPPHLLDDPVYQAFSSPFVREERLLREKAQERAEQEQQRAEQEQQRAEQEQQRAEQEQQRAEQERQRAEQERQRAEQERQRADQEKGRADNYAEMLRKLGVHID